MLNQILYTACVTPFDAAADKIDYQSLERLLREQEKAGNGIVLLGSTGEGLSLTDQERREATKFACKLGLETNLIVGVPSHNLYAALEWLEFCKDLPIQGYLMTTPIYTKPGVLGQTKWFETLLEKAVVPAMLYNIPGRAAIRLHPETVKNLKDHPKFSAIKDSSGTVESIVEYKLAAPNKAVYCGDDYMMPAMAAEGSVGLISVASNPWPEATRRYVQLCLKGKVLKNKIWWQACKALFTASNPIPVKALLKDIEMITHDSVRLPLNLKDLASRQTLLDYHKQITNWEG
jgi:4-hydroxy-tetrahydrodipicolinate synthase